MALHLKSTGIDFTDFGDATESSELLDDYEEGTWSLAFTSGTGFGVTQSSTLIEQYTKVGGLISILASFYINGTAGNKKCSYSHDKL